MYECYAGVLGLDVEGCARVFDKDFFLEDLQNCNLQVLAYSAFRYGSAINGPRDIKSFQGEIEDSLKNNQEYYSGGKTTIILFNEAFFGSDVKSKEAGDALVDCFKDLSKKYTGVAFCINFLVKFSKDHRPLWLPADGITQDAKAKYITVGQTGINEKSREKIFSYKSNKDSVSDRVANCSLLIFGGEVILFYRKSTYFEECDDLCISYSEQDSFKTGACLYEFGDWKTHVIPGIDENFGENLLRMLFFRICADIPVVTGLEARDSLCVILANSVAAGAMGIASSVHDDIFETESTGVFKELPSGSIAIICDSHISTGNGCSVILKCKEDKVKYRYLRGMEKTDHILYYNIKDLLEEKRYIYGEEGGPKCLLL